MMNVTLRKVIRFLVYLTFVATIMSFYAAAADAECHNEAIRKEQKATYLPACRAYELVSAADAVPTFSTNTTGSGEEVIIIKNSWAAAGGEKFVYTGYYPPQGSIEANGFYVAKRTPQGWIDQTVTPSLSPSTQLGCSETMIFSPEITSAVLADGRFQSNGGSAYCGHNEPTLVTGEPPGWRNESELMFQNIFFRSSLEGAVDYELVNRTPSTVVPSDAFPQDVTPDLAHVVFAEAAKLTAEAPESGEALYEWYDGVVHLVSVRTNGTGVAAEIVDTAGHGTTISGAPFMHAVSANGERVFFTAEGKLFVRENATSSSTKECEVNTDPCTIQLDLSHAGGSGGGGQFLVADPEGTRVFFMDEASAKLTSTTVAGSGKNLYEYNLSTDELTDLTPVAHAEMLGPSGFGESAGQSYLYFVADGDLETGATQGQPNLYMIHNEEAPVTIGTLAPGDRWDWEVNNLTANVSPNGRYIAFDSIMPLSKYDNTPPAGRERICEAGNGTPQPCPEVFLYDGESKQLSCASCQPDAAAPTIGGAELKKPVSATFPAEAGPGVLPHDVLDDGTVFFETPEKLVAQAKGEVSNVYEYAGGEVHLLSSGNSPDPTEFVAASESGADVFLATTEPLLVGRDKDSALSIYDARVEGGFPEPASAPSPCVGEEQCRGGAPTSEVFSSPTSTFFSGPGNAVTGGGSSPAPKAAPKPTRAEKLASALRSCKKKGNRKKRRSCESAARKRFGPGSSSAHGSASERKRGGRR